MMVFARPAVTWFARYPQSAIFSGCPSAQTGFAALWPMSVPAVAYLRASPSPATAGMLPPYPPLPMPLNLPFQPVSGSRTSKLIEESLVGVATPFTLQFAGRVAVAATTTALVIVAFGRERVVRLSHDCAADAPADASVMTAKDATIATPTARMQTTWNRSRNCSDGFIGVPPSHRPHPPVA